LKEGTDKEVKRRKCPLTSGEERGGRREWKGNVKRGEEMEAGEGKLGGRGGS